MGMLMGYTTSFGLEDNKK